MHRCERDSQRPGQGSRVRKYSLTNRHGIQAVILCLLVTLGLCGGLQAQSPAVQSTALLDQIWPYQPPDRHPLSQRDQEYAEAALIQWLEAYLHHEYEVIDQRFFWDARNNSMWGPIGIGHASYIEDEQYKWRGVEIKQPWHSPGNDPAMLWKVVIDGQSHYFALAMTKKPVPGTRGRRLIARFELRKRVE